MKSRDIAKKYRVTAELFDDWLKQSRYSYKLGRIAGLEVSDDQDIDEIVADYKAYRAEERVRVEKESADRERATKEAREAAERAAQEKQAALASMLITSGFSFDGFTITKYSGYISGDDAIQIARGTSGFFGRVTDVGASLMESLVTIRRNALAELKEAAWALG